MKMHIYRLSRCDQFRSKVYLLILITLFNFIFGLFLISSVISFVEKTPTDSNLIIKPIEEIKEEPIEIEIEDEHLIVESKVNNHFDYYFRIDYTIVETSCRSILLLNSSTNLIYLKLFTIDKLSFLIKLNETFQLDITSFNTILLRTENKNLANVLGRNSRLSCDYLLELQIGLRFVNNCKSDCQNEYIRRLTSNSRPFGDPIQPYFTFKLNYSSDLTTQFMINRILIYQSTEYLDKYVNIRSLSSNRYVSALILDASGSQSSVIMSSNEQDKLLIKRALDENCFERDSSSIYISFLFATTLNCYLRHENGRIKLSRYQNDYLFKGDATFKLLTSLTNKQIVAFESVNLPGHFIQVDPETKTAIVLIQPNHLFINIEQLDKSFLFQFISL